MKRCVPWRAMSILTVAVICIVWIGTRFYQSMKITIVKEIKIVCPDPQHKGNSKISMMELRVTVPRKKRKFVEAYLSHVRVQYICPNCAKRLGLKRPKRDQNNGRKIWKISCLRI